MALDTNTSGVTPPADPGATTSPPASPPASPPPSPPASPPAVEIPEGFAYAKDGKLDFETWTKDVEELQGYRKVREGVPEKPDAYALNVSQDWKYKDGRPQELKADDPLWGQFREWAHKHAVPQAGIDELLGLYAGANRALIDGQFDEAQAAEQEAETAYLRELASLADPKAGDAGAAIAAVEKRLETLGSWLTRTFKTDGEALAKNVRTAHAIRILEALMEATKDVEIGGAKSASGDPDAGKKKAHINYPHLVRRA